MNTSSSMKATYKKMLSLMRESARAGRIQNDSSEAWNKFRSMAKANKPAAWAAMETCQIPYDTIEEWIDGLRVF